MNRLARVLLLSSFLLVSCSSLEFATSWADTYLDHQIDNYFDLDRGQDVFTSQALKDNIQKIRKDIYPLFAEELRRNADDLEKAAAVSADRIEDAQKRLQALVMKTLALVEPSAQEFVDRLRAEQLKNFEKEFTKKNDKIKKEADDKSIALSEQSDRMEGQLKYWMGSLTYEQRKLVKKFCEENPYPQKERLVNRQKVAAEFVGSFPDVEKRHRFIHILFTDYKSLHEKTYAEAMDKYQKSVRGFLVGFIGGLSADDKKNLIANFRKRADELKKISEKKP